MQTPRLRQACSKQVSRGKADPKSLLEIGEVLIYSRFSDLPFRNLWQSVLIRKGVSND